MADAGDFIENEIVLLYGELNKSCLSQDFDKVIRCSDKILKRYPEEFKAFKCKVVALMHLNNFEQALKFINSNEFVEELLFEKAYCEYRLNQLTEAIETISLANENDEKMQELLAQILYKQENYEDSLKKYKKLVRNINDKYEDERTVNLVANVSALLQWKNERKDFPKVPEAMFESVLNKACYLAADGLFEEALDKLKEAEDMCLKTLEDDPDVTQNEIDEELCPIKVQRAYCLQQLNRIQEASNLYHEVLKKRLGEAHVLAIAANNVVCINRDQNIFDSRKKIRMATSDVSGMQSKLTEKQKSIVSTNNLLFLYYSNQYEPLKTLVKEVLSNYESNIDTDNFKNYARVVLIKSAQLVKEKQNNSATDLIEEFLALITNSQNIEFEGENDDYLLKLYLTLAQLYLSQSSLSRCQDILARLPEHYLHCFGVLSARINLYLASENHQSILQCLDEALEYHKNDDVANYIHLLRISAALCIKLNLYKQAATYYKALLDNHPNDQTILAHLIAAYSRYDKDLAEKTSLQLKEDKSLQDVDVDSLESAFIFGTKHMKKLLKTGETTPGNVKTDSPEDLNKSMKKKNLKKKKIRLPKNYDPSKPMDLERWLPKRERSYYKGRRRDKRSNISRGPQGATGGASIELDASRKPAPTSPKEEATTTPSPQDSAQKSSAGAQKSMFAKQNMKKSNKANKNKKRR